MNNKIEFLRKDTSFQNVMKCENFIIKRFKNQEFVDQKIMNNELHKKSSTLRKF